MSAPDEKILTVIIPAYNVGAFIGDCIRSVTMQPRAQQVLAIVVVDGATDDTLQRAHEAAAGHEGIVRIVEQPNAGLSAARNTGLALARTDYVAFLDGDDVWLDGYLETLLPYVERGEHDIIEYDALRLGEDGKPLWTWKVSAVEDGAVRATNRDEFLTYYRCYAWGRIFKAELVRAHPYPLGRRYEDSATTPWYYWNSKNALGIGVALIGYRQRDTSILATPKIEDVLDIATTTREAAAMYAQTHDGYWQRMAYRSFQQACGRVVFQPALTWPALLRQSRDALGDVPPPPGPMRKFNLHLPLLYTIALLGKHVAGDAFVRLAPRRLIRALFPKR